MRGREAATETEKGQIVREEEKHKNVTKEDFPEGGRVSCVRWCHLCVAQEPTELTRLDWALEVPGGLGQHHGGEDKPISE